MRPDWYHSATFVIRQWMDDFPYDGPSDPDERLLPPANCACQRLGARIGADGWDHVSLHSLDELVSNLRSEIARDRLVQSAALGDARTVADVWQGSGEQTLDDSERDVVEAFAADMRKFDGWLDDRLRLLRHWPERVRAVAARSAEMWPPRIFVEFPPGKTRAVTDSEYDEIERIGQDAADRAVSPAPLDRVEVEAAIDDAYRQLDLPEPETIFHAASPREALVLQEALREVLLALRVDGNVLPDVELPLALEWFRPVMSPESLALIEAWARRRVILGGADESIIDPVPARWFTWTTAWIIQNLEASLTRDDRVRVTSQATGPLIAEEQWRLADLVRAQVRSENEQTGPDIDASIDRADDAVATAHVRALATLHSNGGGRLRQSDRSQHSAGWWWAYSGFAVTSDNPRLLELDSAGRPHSETGPAAEWSDGWKIYSWHGTWVPQELIETEWTIEQIFVEENVEVRRCAIERLGWDRFVEAAGLRIIGETDDPGNPGHTLRLTDDVAGIFKEAVRVLLCTNASVERDGTRRRYGLTVPTSCTDPIQAAAWTFGLDAWQYRELVTAC